MTHRELVEICYEWVLKNAGCGTAFKELKSIDPEIPDVIGFDMHESVLIECKVSRGDFLGDQKKKHRQKGMGNWRFYACPAGMIKVNELPEKWGLIYVNEDGKARIEYDCRKKRIPFISDSEDEVFRTRMVVAEENKFDADTIAERRIMYSALRRLFIKGFMKHIYDKQYVKLKAPQIILLNKITNE